MLNKTLIQGRLTDDPVIRYTNDQTMVIAFCLAVERDYKKSSPVDFIDCVAWRSKAKFISDYFQKGQMMLVTGRLQTRTWTTESGEYRKSSEVLVESVNFCGRVQEDPQPELYDDNPFDE